METYNHVLTVIGSLAVTVTIFTAIVCAILGIIGLVKKNYKTFKTSLKVLLIPVGVIVLTCIAFAIGQLVK
jgi:hypothetical protein